MPRKKTLSDERYNARRRARREYARIVKEMSRQGITSSELATLSGYANRLNQNIMNSYIQKNIVKGMTKKEREEIVKKAEFNINQSKKVLDSRSKSKNASSRTNEIFSQKMNIAASNKRTDIKGLDSDSVATFYISTRRFWQGKSREDRNSEIMRHLGVKSLEEAYRIVMRKNREYLKQYRDMKNNISSSRSVNGWTDESSEFFNGEIDITEGTRITSPIDVYYF